MDVETFASIEYTPNVCTSAESNDDETHEHVNKKCKISKEEEPV